MEKKLLFFTHSNWDNFKSQVQENIIKNCTILSEKLPWNENILFESKKDFTFIFDETCFFLLFTMWNNNQKNVKNFLENLSYIFITLKEFDNHEHNEFTQIFFKNCKKIIVNNFQQQLLLNKYNTEIIYYPLTEKITSIPIISFKFTYIHQQNYLIKQQNNKIIITETIKSPINTSFGLLIPKQDKQSFKTKISFNVHDENQNSVTVCSLFDGKKWHRNTLLKEFELFFDSTSPPRINFESVEKCFITNLNFYSEKIDILCYGTLKNNNNYHYRNVMFQKIKDFTKETKMKNIISTYLWNDIKGNILNESKIVIHIPKNKNIETFPWSKVCILMKLGIFFIIEENKEMYDKKLENLIVFYKKGDFNDLKEKVQYYLENEMERKKAITRYLEYYQTHLTMTRFINFL